MLTDYSSVSFDFTFLNKPVFFYQFDAERLHAPHADPLTELPGPVFRNEFDVLKAIGDSFSNGAVLEEEYQQRADRFLAYRDTQNSARTFDAIRNMRSRQSALDAILHSDFAHAVARISRRQKAYLPTIKAIYRGLRILPIDKNTLVFESDLGRQFGDSPRAIYDELVRRGDGRRKVIVSSKPVRVQDEHTLVVKRHSPGFIWHMARAKYWVNNNQFPDYVRRRKHGRFIQTWHGTPLKRLFEDQENFYGRDAGYIDRIKTMSAQWSELISPSPHASETLRTSYAYSGPIHEIGYPRNDILLSTNRDKVGRSIRQQLGITPESYVVLYAPTFRDDQPTTQGRFAFSWPFDPHELNESLAEDVVVLMRKHFLVNTKIRIPDSLRHKFIDVSKYPNVQELFLASDMLVTDYSSLFFDYALLQRPIVFYPYDLENYRDELRGFYLDYESDVPGPIATTAEQLAAHINRMADPETRPEMPIPSSFLRRFAPYDDGFASERVVDKLLS